MFGSRRHRPPNPPLTAATANPNATTAAAAVFRRNDSNPSLSAAAAAAALRARPTTPTRVADVQTKRTVRRSNSVASTATASEHGHDRPDMRRRGSSGSMTERTFRTPSPHRPGSNGSGHQQIQPLSFSTPPVPALPKNMDLGPRQPGGGNQYAPNHRRTNSLGTGNPPVRLASQTLGSGDAPSWFGGAKLGDLANVRRTDPAMASPPSSPLQASHRGEDLPEGLRPNSQASSINFSYPTWMRLSSPTATQTPEHSVSGQMPPRASQSHPSADDRQTSIASRVAQQSGAQAAMRHARTRSTSSSSDQALVYDPNSRRMVRQADLLALQQPVLEAPQQPTVPKKRRAQRAGSHLAAGTLSRTKSDASHPAPTTKIPTAAAVQVQTRPTEAAAPVREVQADVDEPAVKAIISSPRIDAKRLEQQRSREAVDFAQISATALPTSTPAPATPDATRQGVRRAPSVVREEPEPEDSEAKKKPRRVIVDALDAAPVRQGLHTSPQRTASLITTLTGQGPKSGSADVSKDGVPKPGATENGRPAQVLRERTHSSSPARQTHFGPVQENLTIRHSPPPRSVSPRKSALKHTSPPRGPSPGGDTSEASGSATQEPPVARKKSVRVSFDDANTVAVGDSVVPERNDSPLPASPQHSNRHSWFSNLGRIPKELPSLDDDEVMKPRPALPSFGSVRDRKPRETSPTQEERPLVRPKGELRSSPPLLPSPPLGPSNDHVIGAILSKQEDGFKHPANTSRLREPLPPVVTSVEGSGYLSDSSDASTMISSEYEPPETVSPATVSEPRTDAAPESETVLPKNIVNGSVASTSSEPFDTQETTDQYDTPPESHIPMISVSQPTPLGAEMAGGQYFAEIPGGFPDDESNSTASDIESSTQAAVVAKPVEDIATNHQSPQPALQATQPTETSSDSESSIYSDAYEDLSEIEGDGFQSLDAVIDSPLERSPRSVAQPQHVAPESPVHKAPQVTPKLQTEISSATTAVETPPTKSADEWEKAKAYWRSLTAERRAQLEREAIEEAGTEADMEEVQPEAKSKKKKTVERRNSERKALAVRMAQQQQQQQQQMMLQDGEQKLANPERNYMIKPGEKWSTDDLAIPSVRRNSTRSNSQAAAAPVEGARLRKTMRASGSSLNSSGSVSNRTAARRPMSSPPASAASSIGQHRRSATQMSPQLEHDSGKAGNFPLPAKRRGSTGSESSFKRSSPGIRAQGFGFRQSLRPTSPPSAQNDARLSKRFSLRSSSSQQNTDAPPSVASTNTPMRTTLRGSSPRRKKSPTGGIRMPSFGLSYGGKKSGSAKTAKRKSSGSRFSSRLADSSDEDGDGAVSSGFRSRFEDSSDDDDGPVMPIPVPLLTTSHSATTPQSATHSLRQQPSLASTALPEELEESESIHEPATQITTNPNNTGPPAAADTTNSVAATLRRTRSGRGQLPTPQTTPSPTSKRRNSFMSVLRHRRKLSGDAAASGNGDKVVKAGVSESAARRDTRLERSVGLLRGLREEGGDGIGDEEDEEEGGEVVEARSPKLRKRERERGVESRKAGDGMVTPAVNGGGGGERFEKEEEGEEEDGVFGTPQQLKRTGTSSGNLGTRTLSGGFLQRRVSSMSGANVPPSVDGSVAGASSTTRKKRFGTLRRMFGLDE